MRLPGNLKSTTLGDLLGRLYREGCSGTLELVEDRGQFSGRRHQIHLAGGLVESVDTELPVARLGEILVDEGLVSQQAVDCALEQVLDGTRPAFGQALVSAKALSNAVLVAALRYQVRRRLDSLFALKEAMVRFRVPRPRRPSERPIPLSPREFLFGRPRRRGQEPRRGAAYVAPGSGNPAGTSQGGRRARALRQLGLAQGASEADVRQAFRRLARQHHPDCFPGVGGPRKRELLTRFAELSAAYHALLGERR